ncbi:MAG: methylamine utilization protein [Gammaproteobacteria bacterium]|nr:methylamine utilization protein [Gammaproteobacteria bacterium]
MRLVSVATLMATVRLLTAGALIIGACAAVARASDLDVSVVDRDGKPVPNVAVYAVPLGEASGGSAATATATMNQIDVQFHPHILIVQQGTAVSFPNTDTIAHHVYSFSDPQQFDLAIYKGDLHPPVTFDRPGLVTLGCNIHDNMLGYILVVETDMFGKTNNVGQATLPLNRSGEFKVRIWSPRIRDRSDSLSRTVTLSGGRDQVLRFSLESKLRPPRDSDSGALAWSDY